MKKGSMLTALLLAMVMCFSGFAVAESMPVVDDLVLTPDEQTTAGSEVTTLSAYEMLQLQAQAAQMYNDMVATTTLADFYAQLESAYYADEAVRALFTVDQTNALYAHADALYALEDPEDEDAYNLYEEVSALIAWVFGAEDARVLADATWSGTVTGKTYTASTDIYVSGNVTLNDVVTIPKGVTVNIRTAKNTTNKTYTITRGTGTGAMFVVEEGGRLRIQGNAASGASGNTLIVDGGAKWSKEDPTDGTRTNSGKKVSQAAIVCHGYLTLSDMIIQNNDNTSGEGGGLRMAPNTETQKGDASISSIEIRKCAAQNGGAIKLDGNFTAIEDGDGDGYGFTMNNSKVYYNHSRDNAGGTIRSNGASTGIYRFSGCEIYKNRCEARGGAFYWNGAGSAETKLLINACNLHDNWTGSHGGAIMNESVMQITGVTKIHNNHSSGSGGGIYLSTYQGGMEKYSGDGYTLTLGSSTSVYENTAANYGGGIYLSILNSKDVDKKNALFKCVIDGASITQNHAANGGAIAINDTGDKAEYANRVLTVNAGSIISNNTADNNGGAVFVDRTGNKAMTVTIDGTFENNTATSGSGGAFYLNATGNATLPTTFAGTMATNKAPKGNGGAIYLNGGNFTLSSGSITGIANTAIAKNGGAVYVKGGSFTMQNGTVQQNVVSADGGAVYVSGGSFTINNGEIKVNKANGNGGAAYVTGGNFTMSNGTMSGNEAVDGGAVYVVGSNASSNYFTMKNGTLSDNEASNNGGAVYVATGSALVEDGSLTDNNAENGGAVYVSGGNFTMTSGTMTDNKTVTQTSSDDGYGGAVCITSGTIQIGVKDCDSIKTKETHSVAGYTDKKHPKVENNTAIYGGALAVRGNGAVYIYCGNVVNNVANNRGTGMNVFMDGDTSIFHHYLDNSNIGTEHDHGLVTTGGTLKVYQKNSTTGTELKIVFDPNRSHITTTWEGEVPEGYYLNLPYCPDSWNLAESTDTFVGWTEKPLGTDPNSLRKKDYMQVGDPTELVDQGNNTMTFYAVWAPAVSNITYKYALDDGLIAGDLSSFNSSFTAPATYRFSMTSGTVNIGVPAKAGYAFHGWRIYADSDTMSNWDADANPIDPTKLEDLKQYAAYQFDKSPAKDNVFLNTDSYLLNNNLKTLQSFGDITLVAVYEPQFAKLSITKAFDGVTADDSLSYIFHVVGNSLSDNHEDVDMYVTVQGDGTTTLAEMPVGSYTVTEMNEWSWRYSDAAAQTKDVMNPEETTAFTFTNSLDKTKTQWLDDEDGINNNFKTGTVTNFQ